MKTNLILAILAAVLLIPTIQTLRGNQIDFTEYDNVPRLFEGFTTAKVAGIVISIPKRSPDGSLVKGEDGVVSRDVLQLLKRSDNNWQVGRHPLLPGALVQNERVFETILDPIERIRRDEKALVAIDADDDTLRRYGLDEESAVLLQCYNPGQQGVVPSPIVELYVGKDASGGKTGAGAVSGFYVRKKDRKEVVLYETNFWALTADHELWLERNLLKFDVKEVVKFALQNETGSFALKKESAQQGSWDIENQPEGTGALRFVEVEGALTTLSMLNVQQIVEPWNPQNEAQYGLNQGATQAVAVVTMSNGDEHELRVGKTVRDKNEVYLHISSQPFLLTAGEWLLSNHPMGTRVDKFFDPSAERVKPDGK